MRERERERERTRAFLAEKTLNLFLVNEKIDKNSPQ